MTFFDRFLGCARNDKVLLGMIVWGGFYKLLVRFGLVAYNASYYCLFTGTVLCWHGCKVLLWKGSRG